VGRDLLSKAIADFSDLTREAAKALAELEALKKAAEALSGAEVKGAQDATSARQADITSLRAQSDAMRTVSTNSDLYNRAVNWEGNTNPTQFMAYKQKEIEYQRLLNIQKQRGFYSPQQDYAWRQQELAQQTLWNRAVQQGFTTPDQYLGYLSAFRQAQQLENAGWANRAILLKQATNAQTDYANALEGSHRSSAQLAGGTSSAQAALAALGRESVNPVINLNDDQFGLDAAADTSILTTLGSLVAKPKVELDGSAQVIAGVSAIEAALSAFEAKRARIYAQPLTSFRAGQAAMTSGTNAGAGPPAITASQEAAVARSVEAVSAAEEIAAIRAANLAAQTDRDAAVAQRLADSFLNAGLSSDEASARLTLMASTMKDATAKAQYLAAAECATASSAQEITSSATEATSALTALGATDATPSVHLDGVDTVLAEMKMISAARDRLAIEAARPIRFTATESMRIFAPRKQMTALTAGQEPLAITAGRQASFATSAEGTTFASAEEAAAAAAKKDATAFDAAARSARGMGEATAKAAAADAAQAKAAEDATAKTSAFDAAVQRIIHSFTREGQSASEAAGNIKTWYAGMSDGDAKLRAMAAEQILLTQAETAATDKQEAAYQTAAQMAQAFADIKHRQSEQAAAAARTAAQAAKAAADAEVSSDAESAAAAKAAAAATGDAFATAYAKAAAAAKAAASAQAAADAEVTKAAEASADSQAASALKGAVANKAAADASKVAWTTGGGRGGFWRAWTNDLILFGGAFDKTNIKFLQSMKVWALAVHVLLDFLIVLVPAIIAAGAALGAFALAAEPAFLDIKAHVTGLHTAMDALGTGADQLGTDHIGPLTTKMGTLTSTTKPMATTIRSMQAAMAPTVVTIFGAAIDGLGNHMGLLQSIAQKTGIYIEDMIIKIESAVKSRQGALGGLVSTFSNDMHILGSIGHSLLAIFGDFVSAGEKLHISELLFEGLAYALSLVQKVMSTTFGRDVTVAIIAIASLVHYGGLLETAMFNMYKSIVNAVSSLSSLAARIPGVSDAFAGMTTRVAAAKEASATLNDTFDANALALDAQAAAEARAEEAQISLIRVQADGAASAHDLAAANAEVADSAVALEAADVRAALTTDALAAAEDTATESTRGLEGALASLAAIPAGVFLAIAAAIAGIGFAIYKAGQASSQTQAFISKMNSTLASDNASQGFAQIQSNLASMGKWMTATAATSQGAVYNMGQGWKRLATDSSGFAGKIKDFWEAVSGTNQDPGSTKAVLAAQTAQQKDWTTTIESSTYATKRYGVTAQESFAMMDLAGVKVTDSLAVQKAKVDALVTGWTNMGVAGYKTSTNMNQLGNAIGAVSLASETQNSQITKLTGDYTAFVGMVTSGQNAFDSFATGISNLGTGLSKSGTGITATGTAAKVAGASMSGLNSQSIALRAAWEANLTAGQSLYNSLVLQNAAAGNTAKSSAQLAAAGRDVVSSLLAQGGASQESVNGSYALAQTMGYVGPATYKALMQWSGGNKSVSQSTADLNKEVLNLETESANLQTDVKNLAAAVGTNLNQAIAQGLVNMPKMTKSVSELLSTIQANKGKGFTPQEISASQQLSNALISTYGTSKAGLLEAKNEFITTLMDMGLSQKQALQLWSDRAKKGLPPVQMSIQGPPESDGVRTAKVLEAIFIGPFKVFFKFFQDGWKASVDLVLGILKGLGDLLTGNLGGAARALVQGLDQAGRAMRSLWDSIPGTSSIDKAFRAVWNAIFTGFQHDVADKIYNFFNGGSADSLPGALRSVSKTMAGVFSGIGKDIKNWSVTGWQAFDKDFVHPISRFFVTDIPSWLTRAGKDIKNWAVDGWQAFDDHFIHPIVDWMVHWWRAAPVAKDIKNWAVDGWQAFDNDFIHPIQNFFLKDIPNWFRNSTKDTKNWAVNSWQAFDNDFIHPIQNFFLKDIPNWFRNATKDTKNWAVTAWQAFDNDFIHPIQNFFLKDIPNWARNIWTAVKNAVVEAWQAFENSFIHPIQNFFTQTVPSLAGHILGGIKNAAVSAWQSFDKSFVQPIENFFTSIPGKIAHAFSSLGSAILHAIPGGGVASKVFHFLGLAEGGHVPGHGEGDTVPAMLTPGEFVIRKPARKALEDSLGPDILHKLNRADKVTGTPVTDRQKGVQHFAAGGSVGSAQAATITNIASLFATDLTHMGVEWNQASIRMGTQFAKDVGGPIKTLFESQMPGWMAKDIADWNKLWTGSQSSFTKNIEGSLQKFFTSTMTGWLTSFIGQWQATFSKAWNAVNTSVVSSLQKFFTGTMPGWLSQFSAQWTATFTKAWNTVQTVIVAAMQKFFTSTMSGYLTTLSGEWTSTWTKAWTTVDTILVSGFTSLFTSKFPSWFSALDTSWTSMWTSAYGKFQTALENPVKQWFTSTLPSAMSEGFRLGMNTAISSVLNTVVGFINNDVLKNLPGGLKVSTVPKVATGGTPFASVAGSGEFDSQPAMLMPGEFVLRKPARMALESTYGPDFMYRMNQADTWLGSGSRGTQASQGQPARGYASGGGIGGAIASIGAGAAKIGKAAAGAASKGQQDAEAMLSYMNAQIGKPYNQSNSGSTDRFGPNDFDCSGLVWAAAHHAGVNIPGGPSDSPEGIVGPEMVSFGQISGATLIRKVSQVQAGDILAFTGADGAGQPGFNIMGASFPAGEFGHIGMAQSSSAYVSAYDTADGVSVHPISGDQFNVAIRLGGGAGLPGTWTTGSGGGVSAVPPQTIGQIEGLVGGSPGTDGPLTAKGKALSAVYPGGAKALLKAADGGVKAIWNALWKGKIAAMIPSGLAAAIPGADTAVAMSGLNKGAASFYGTQDTKAKATQASQQSSGGSSSGTGGGPVGNITGKTQWANAVLKELGDTAKPGAVQALVHWATEEGGNWNNSAKYNPINTTLHEPGSTNPGFGAGVQAYTSWAEGIKATVDTLDLSPYGGIRAALKAGDYAGVGSALLASPWGTTSWSTGGLVTAPGMAKGGSAQARDLEKAQQAETVAMQQARNGTLPEMEAALGVLSEDITTASRLKNSLTENSYFRDALSAVSKARTAAMVPTGLAKAQKGARDDKRGTVRAALGVVATDLAQVRRWEQPAGSDRTPPVPWSAVERKAADAQLAESRAYKAFLSTFPLSKKAEASGWKTYEAAARDRFLKDTAHKKLTAKEKAAEWKTAEHDAHSAYFSRHPDVRLGKKQAHLLDELSVQQDREDAAWRKMYTHATDWSRRKSTDVVPAKEMDRLFAQFGTAVGNYDKKLDPKSDVHKLRSSWNASEYDALRNAVKYELPPVAAMRQMWGDLRFSPDPGPEGRHSYRYKPPVASLPGVKAPPATFAMGGMVPAYAAGGSFAMPEVGIQSTQAAGASTRSQAAQASSGPGASGPVVNFNGGINITNPTGKTAPESITHATQRAAWLTGRQLAL
jgi:chemotaxis protein histidine kinase CheA